MKLKTIVSLILVIFIFDKFNLIAQSSSSYSRFGMGDIDYSYSIRRMGMGQLGASIADVDFISTINPASLHRLAKTRIEFSANYNGTFLSGNQKKNYYGESNFGGFTIGIPISNSYGIGMAFGLVPYTNVSYKVVESLSSDNTLIGDYNVEYSGKGGLSRLFFASSFSLPMDLSIGASFDYYFGNRSYSSMVSFLSTNTFSSEYEKKHESRGIGGTFGLISPDISQYFSSQSIKDFRIGLAVSLFSDLKDDTLFSSSSVVGIDTLSAGSGEIQMPAKLTVGMSFILAHKYLFSLDFSSQAWSKYSVNNILSSELQNGFKLSTGFEYRPLRELGSTFWEQIIFRAGLSYEQTQYLIKGKGINQYSVSTGMSLPLGLENTLDLGLIYSRRGTKESNLFQEDIIKFGIGFSLGELWFLRQEK